MNESINVFEITNRVLAEEQIDNIIFDKHTEKITFAGISYSTDSKYALSSIGADTSITASASYTIQEKKITPHYCPSCGATLKQDQNKCKYCLTEFW